MKTICKNVCLLICAFLITTLNGENITAAELESDSKYLNNFINISNSPPEIIDYYDLDVMDGVGGSDVLGVLSASSEPMQQNNMPIPMLLPQQPPPEIYPDPDLILKQTTNLNQQIANDVQRNQQIHLVRNSVQVSGKEVIVKDRNNEDLKEHDSIDNIMYIYYGSNGSMRKSLGGSIIIVGAVCSLAAQILAIVLSILRNRRLRQTNELATISLNLLSTLCASNFVFIVGVQASKTLFKCNMIAILLHYFHLSTSIWGLCHTYTIYDFVINENSPNLKYQNLCSYVGSGLYVLLSFVTSNTSYETFDYCWMSVQRGMIINFMIPISALIVATTIYGTLTLRSVAVKQREVIVKSIEDLLDKCQHMDAVMPSVDKCCEEMTSAGAAEKLCDTDLKRIDFYDSKFDLGALSIADLSLQSSNESQDYAEFKHAIKISLFFQPAFAVCWFLGVVALENRFSCVMPVTFIICFNILNWYILYRSAGMSPLIFTTNSFNSKTPSSLQQFEVISNNNEETSTRVTCTDTIPLLCSAKPSTSTNIHEGCSYMQNSSTNLSSSSSSSYNGRGAAAVLSTKSYEDEFFRSTNIHYHNQNQQCTWETSMENINLDCISTISN